MEDNVLAEKTLRSRLENMDQARLVAVSIEVLAAGSALFPLKKVNCCLNVPVPVNKEDVPCFLKMIEQYPLFPLFPKTNERPSP